MTTTGNNGVTDAGIDAFYGTYDDYLATLEEVNRQEYCVNCGPVDGHYCPCLDEHITSLEKAHEATELREAVKRIEARQSAIFTEDDIPF